MTRKYAEEKGYRFTGHYGRYKEEIKIKKEIEFKNKGYKAVIVTVPDSKYSRSLGEGYSIFAEQKYFDDRRIELLTSCCEGIKDRKDQAKKDYEIEIDRINKDALSFEEELDKLKMNNNKG